MKKQSTYIDDCLIRLRRTYSKDETVAALNKKLSEVELELGKANAYIHELEERDVNEGLKQKIKNILKTNEIILNKNKAMGLKIKEHEKRITALKREMLTNQKIN